MKVAVVYNRESKSVINLFGMPNREKIGMKTIHRVTTALKAGGHQVIALEGDKDLIDRLEEFMPRVVQGERPGLVFNVSYGIQGQARYTHVPSILEMVGIPYVASGPLAHSLALDKVVTKMILRQHNLPTPEYTVLQTPDSSIPDNLPYPMIVKPKNEAVSFGLKVVHDEKELRDAAQVIFKEFRQAVLAEQFIEGREVNVGLLGNDPPEIFPPVELVFASGGPSVYTYEDKTGRSGRTISHACPAPIGDILLARAKAIAVEAFQALGCADCARVDMRLDGEGNLYILEVNSLPSLGEHGSYLVGAAHVGLDFTKVINRLVEAASARYFGTPQPARLTRGAIEDSPSEVFSYVTQQRDRMERRLREWTAVASRTSDPMGIQQASRKAADIFEELKMSPVDEFTREPWVWTWSTAKGLDNGMLFVANLDVPVDADIVRQQFRRDPEWLYGEGIGSSRGPLVMLEFAFRALRNIRGLRRLPLGVLLYADEGQDARYSAETIRAAAAAAKEVFILRPGNVPDRVILQRRGQRRYRLRVESEPIRLGRTLKRPDPLRWTWANLEQAAGLSSPKDRVSVFTMHMRTEHLPMHLPHRVSAALTVAYPTPEVADQIEEKIREIFGKRGYSWELDRISDRPPMKERPGGRRLFRELHSIAGQWEIPLDKESSVWPSVAGLLPAGKACLCGFGPVAHHLRSPQEALQRISLIQRTLLLSQFLVKRLP